MLFTKLIGFVALLVVAVICNAGELSREKSNSRLDAEQEPFKTLIMVDANGPSSTLFNGCLAASRTLEAKLYSIEVIDSGPEFIRYVPDSYQLMVLPKWEQVPRDPPVSSILECATATFEAGFDMFKYNGGDDCKVASQIYDLAYEPACETEEQDAVFINSDAVSECPPPFVMLDVDPVAGNYICLLFTTELMVQFDAISWCSSRGAAIFTANNGTIYEEVVQILKDLNLGTSDFFIDASLGTDNIWRWTELGTIDTSLMVTAPVRSNLYLMYMKGSAGFKFDFGLGESFKAGTVCTATREL